MSTERVGHPRSILPDSVDVKTSGTSTLRRHWKYGFKHYDVLYRVRKEKAHLHRPLARELIHKSRSSVPTGPLI
jgi:hypothetical protein